MSADSSDGFMDSILSATFAHGLALLAARPIDFYFSIKWRINLVSHLVDVCHQFCCQFAFRGSVFSPLCRA